MRNKKKIIALLFLCMLIFLCFFIGNSFEKVKVGEKISPTFTPYNTLTPTPEDLSESTQAPTKNPTQMPKPTRQPETMVEVTEEKKEEKVSILIECKTIFNNIDKLKESKKEIIPDNGIILPEISVEFIEGESAFDLLLRISKEKKIHLEFVTTPVYNSVYVEGIANLYEFDCGDKSGWTYKLNGEKLSYGASDCILKAGDCVEWCYTCDMGRDV